MEFNLIKIGFTIITFGIVIVGGLINNFEKHLPTFIVQAFRYGKFAYRPKGKLSFLTVLEVPKR